MPQAKCNKCGGSAIADTYEQARKLINHAIGLARGIKCGDAYGAVEEIQQKVKTIATQTKKEEPKVTEVILQEKVEPKTEKTKTASRKSKNKNY